MRRFKLITIAIMGSLLLCSTFTTKAEENSSSVTSTEIMAHVQRIQKAINAIRLEMDKPIEPRKKIKVIGITPREKYFQALTLYTKANRLEYELTHKKHKAINPPNREITRKDLIEVLTETEKSLQKIKNYFGIKKNFLLGPPPGWANPNDIFSELVQMNRQINILLEQRFSPSDVFQQITVGIQYAAELLAQFQGENRIPKAPKYIHQKKPADVFSNLYSSFKTLQEIAHLSNVKMMKFTEDPRQAATIEPNDVYQMATLIVSELAYLNSLLKNSNLEIISYYPGKKLPSHVYQRAKILKTQLIMLLEQVKKNPHWLVSQ